MKESLYGELSVIGMPGCEQFVSQVDNYLREWRRHGEDESFLAPAECPRFGTGEGKGMLHQSMRGHDVYIFCDPFNYGVTYKMRGQIIPMSPDDHYADLKRIIAAIAGKSRRISIIMPMLYEGRQHKRSGRESLDCALMLQELENMGVSNIITFDAHDPRVQNSIPLCGFDDIRPAYQMLKKLVREVPDICFDKDELMIISPDEGAMGRCMYYSSVLGIDIGMFYKRRDYSKVVNGKNPIVAHEYLGQDVAGKDVIIVDDMISSGESLLDVARQLKEQGAKRIFNFATFGLFTDGYARFDKAFEEGLLNRVFTTNLIYGPAELKAKPWYAEVNMCKYVAYIIDTLNHDETISNLLDPVKRIHNLLDRHNREMGGQIKMDFKAEN
ncbi:MAG: ribose-phosphate pyrophosphokinase [Clostridia bacterium]|nr:ribose-phosphate pyrophosphokinase [Clostridia bacterium]MDD7700236.1 ribose-phosphate pyrophosphokinase [Eubacteriales bacterium]MDY2827106.1 ribose-phosphate pyrophosphokinase [Eubacteriales bacterium]